MWQLFCIRLKEQIFGIINRVINYISIQITQGIQRNAKIIQNEQ
jgi:hypothetical protein